jgi:hypothetical protein
MGLQPTSPTVGVIDATETDTGLCLSSASFPSIILNDAGTPVFSVKISSTQYWYYISVSVMEPDTSI